MRQVVEAARDRQQVLTLQVPVAGAYVGFAKAILGDHSLGMQGLAMLGEIQLTLPIAARSPAPRPGRRACRTPRRGLGRPFLGEEIMESTSDCSLNRSEPTKRAAKIPRTKLKCGRSRLHRCRGPSIAPPKPISLDFV